jgi:lipoprotein-anchoring transpeptidase ErfK/SrfK
VQKLQRPNAGRSAYFRNRESLLAMTASAALLAGLTSANALPLNVQAQYEAGRPVVKANRLAVASREKSPAKAKASTDDVAAKAKGLLSVIISIDKQRLTLYSDGQPIAYSRVSTGVPGHPTPTGVFSIIQKDRWHRSNIYYNAPMYFMQRITWSGVAMHEGVVPNSPASHGCIRLPGAFARQMWGITRLGVRVIVTHGEVTPVAISNERLFTIKHEPAEPKGEAQANSPETVGGAPNAFELAQLSKRDGQANTVFDVSKPLTPALDAMAYALGTPRETTGPDVKPAEPRPLKPGPISVFISRKEGKLFVRKGFEPVFDAPVTFEQPDRPLGTHVFTALAVNDDNTTLRWNVVSMPGATKPAPVKKSAKGKHLEPAAAPVMPASNASEALDRVTIPPDALQRISELMSPGASLIISDKGLGGETGKGTDFIVLTR